MMECCLFDCRYYLKNNAVSSPLLPEENAQVSWSCTRGLFFEKNCFSALASEVNMGLINKGCYGMFFAREVWCIADVSSVRQSRLTDYWKSVFK